MSGRDTARPLPFWQAVRGVFALSFEGMLWSRRSLFMALLLCLPIAIGLLYRAVLAAELATRVGGADLYAVLVVLFYVRNALPLAALFYATSLIAEEVEGRTLTYLLTRPLPRAAILVGKYAAYLATVLILALPATVVSFLLLVSHGGMAAVGEALPDLLRDLAVISLTLAAYGSLFALFGVVLKRPVIPGLVFLFVWESFANLPGYLPRLTLTLYARSLLSHRPPLPGMSDLFGQVLPAALSVAVLLGATALALAAAVAVFSRREYVMEQ